MVRALREGYGDRCIWGDIVVEHRPVDHNFCPESVIRIHEAVTKRRMKNGNIYIRIHFIIDVERHGIGICIYILHLATEAAERHGVRVSHSHIQHIHEITRARLGRLCAGNGSAQGVIIPVQVFPELRICKRYGAENE